MFQSTAGGAGSSDVPSKNMPQQQLLLGNNLNNTPLQYSSVAASSPHDPLLTLASQVIRTNFGVTVQTVADCLQCRGEIPITRLVYYLQEHKKRKCMLQPPITMSTPQIRAALLVLMQHSIVTVKYQQRQHAAASNKTSSSNIMTTMTTHYRYHPERALHCLRYAKIVDYLRKAGDPTAACVVEELLLMGRLRTIDLTVQASEHAPKSDKYTVRQSVMDALCKLVNAGFIERAPPLKLPDDNEDDDDDDDGEMEFGQVKLTKKKGVKLDVPAVAEKDAYTGEDPAVVALLQHHAHYKATLPVDAVWRVDIDMFQEHLRAHHLGKLVTERHGHRVQSAGTFITAALKYRAAQQQDSSSLDATVFAVSDIVKYIPKAVLQLMEKKAGGVTVNLHQAWKDLSELTNPQVVRRVGDDRYEIAVTALSNYLRDRIVYQMVHDRHGEVAARVVSILSQQGYLESDRLAETAMVPAKDTREVLHHLYRSRYVELMQLSSSRQYNPANTTYLWGVERPRLMQKITENVATALWNIRLRREHEVEVGKNWIERAQQAADTDENDHGTDKLNYQKFCLGLERLDVAALQLDETFMALCEF